jgi:hypothetical protein
MALYFIVVMFYQMEAQAVARQSLLALSRAAFPLVTKATPSFWVALVVVAVGLFSFGQTNWPACP